MKQDETFFALLAEKVSVVMNKSPNTSKHAKNECKILPNMKRFLKEGPRNHHPETATHASQKF
jgi:hypothetical protein